jgi:hypothetical protein
MLDKRTLRSPKSANGALIKGSSCICQRGANLYCTPTARFSTLNHSLFSANGLRYGYTRSPEFDLMV